MKTHHLFVNSLVTATIGASSAGACVFPATCLPCPATLSSVVAASARPQTTGSAPVLNVEIFAFSFNPAEAVVPVGASVRWTNLDSIEHSTLSQTGQGTLVPSGVWESPLLNLNESYSIVTDVPAGQYWYFCAPHGSSMEGVIDVRGPGDATGDRRTDIDDFGVLAANFNLANRTYVTGDFNLSGTTDIDDFAVLAGHFNEQFAAGARPTAVPEPAAVGLLSAGWLLSRRRRAARGVSAIPTGARPAKSPRSR